MALLDNLQQQAEQGLDLSITTEGFDEDKIPGLVDGIFTEALSKRASDIHFKPLDDKFMVYFRIDGQMLLHREFEKIFHHPIIARIKITSGLKIDEHRLPQDGKSSFISDEKEVDLRVSVLPTSFGEKVVIRLLDKSPSLVQLRDLGMLPSSL
ncbi:Flp pilus assembly complex ATPase component TadA, partial [Candidatus Pacearchaeota archaeon]|nr:Flp pilus assembly complex ATPase component TadA [Candidatus Pacearchaeota archaeon]